MKKVFIILLIAQFGNLFAQPGNNQAILKVQGESTLKFQPDESIANFWLEAKNLEYDKTVQKLGKKTDDLVATLKNLGFSEDKFKTAQFNISKNYVYNRNQRQDSGYVGRQLILLEFPYEREKIITMINTLSGSVTDPSFSFSFRLSESKQQEAEEQLINLAVKDARTKAGILAGAAGMKITGVKEIVYGITSEPGPQMFRMREASENDGQEFGGFYVQDITVTKTVQIVYFIDSEN